MSLSNQLYSIETGATWENLAHTHDPNRVVLFPELQKGSTREASLEETTSIDNSDVVPTPLQSNSGTAEAIPTAPPEKPPEVQARQALATVGAEAALEKRVAVQAAVDMLNDRNTIKQVRARFQPEKKKTERLVEQVQKAPTLHATLRHLKELKMPLRRLHVQQTLQELLLTGRYQYLLETEERAEDASGTPVESAPPSVETLMKIIEKRLDRDEKSNTGKQLDEYITTWTQYQLLRKQKTQQEIDLEEKEMRECWRKQKHSQIENIGFGKRFFHEVLSRNVTIQTLDPSEKDSKLNAHVQMMLDFLCDIIGERITTEYINDEGLDSSLADIQIEIANRTQELVERNDAAWKYRVNARVIAMDVKRRETLANALLLGDKELEKKHAKEIQEVIKAAEQPVPPEEREALLPQLVEARVPRNAPDIRLEVVFESTVSIEQKTTALQEVGAILPGPVEMGDRPIIMSKQTNIHAEFCANKEKLAKLGIRAVVMGEYGLEEVRNRSKSNIIYSSSGMDTAEGFISRWFFIDNRSEEPYYAPIGWRRVAVDIGYDEEEFWDLYGPWPVAYHGTRSNDVASILEQGIRPSSSGCFFEDLSGMQALYLSPSIEYAAHPRYAAPVKRGNKWVQVVLQVRVNPQLLIEKKPGTLPGALPSDPTPADTNFPNDKLEWVLSALPGFKLSASDIVVSGIMLRVTNEHPRKLTCTQWWGHPPKDIRMWRLTMEQWE